MDMQDCQDLAVPKEVIQHVVHVESSRNPFAIGVVGGYLARQPRSLEEALAAVQQLKREGYNFSVGIAQVNRYNLAKYGLATYAEAFDVCANLKAGSRILRECYDRAQDWGKAFSCYYSGNFVTGFHHGYVQKIFASMRRAQYGVTGQAEPIRIIPYDRGPRKQSREDSLPLGRAGSATDGPAAVHAAPSAYPEPYAIRKYQPSTPLSVTAAAIANSTHAPARQLGEAEVAAETAEGRPAMPVPGPGAVTPVSKTPASNDLSHIPTQVVGVNGDPYQTRVLPPQTVGLPGDRLPLPDPNAPNASAEINPRKPPKSSADRAITARKGGSLLHTNESPAKSENTAEGGQAQGESVLERGGSGAADKSFVF
ncbi:lytic transglycosylase domain-containing protein [Hydrogenophaga taeniospiralis]|uniref:lytic transglycosylase domain-containing protein n=1 Tax=Hydrogenophaga taeniospiralis TaxID=65656 RepID=UPI000A5942A9|nr:lytic transglycosylase domain-containing protein [Hydrogenophaga taeniospiralis]